MNLSLREVRECRSSPRPREATHSHQHRLRRRCARRLTVHRSIIRRSVMSPKVDIPFAALRLSCLLASNILARLCAWLLGAVLMRARLASFGRTSQMPCSRPFARIRVRVPPLFRQPLLLKVPGIVALHAVPVHPFIGRTPAYRKGIRCIGFRYASLEKLADRFRRRAIHRSKGIVVSFKIGYRGKRFGTSRNSQKETQRWTQLPSYR